MTLGDYRNLAEVLGKLLGRKLDNRAVKFFDDKIAQDGADAEVVADERQMIFLLASLLQEDR